MKKIKLILAVVTLLVCVPLALISQSFLLYSINASTLLYVVILGSILFNAIMGIIAGVLSAIHSKEDIESVVETMLSQVAPNIKEQNKEQFESWSKEIKEYVRNK